VLLKAGFAFVGPADVEERPGKQFEIVLAER
jgi:hypothetical protein